MLATSVTSFVRIMVQKTQIYAQLHFVGKIVALTNLVLYRKTVNNLILNQEVVAMTTLEYSAASSLHGLQYIFESGRHLSLSRVMWVVVVITAAALGIFWSVEASRFQNIFTRKILPQIISGYEDLLF